MEEIPYRLLYGPDWRRLQKAIHKLQAKEPVGAGLTLWSGLHLVKTDGSSVDFSLHPPVTVFWAPKSLPASSPIVQQFRRRGWPIKSFDYPPRKDQDAWLRAMLKKKGLPVHLSAAILESIGNDYARLSLEIDRLALAKDHAQALLPAGASGEALLKAWQQMSVSKMQRSFAQMKEAELAPALQRLLSRAYNVYAAQNGQEAGTAYQQLEAGKAARKVDPVWVENTLAFFSQAPAAHLELAEATFLLGRSKIKR